MNAYDQGAKRVHVEYVHPELDFLDYKNVDKEDLLNTPECKSKEREFWVEDPVDLSAFIL